MIEHLDTHDMRPATMIDKINEVVDVVNSLTDTDDAKVEKSTKPSEESSP